MLADARVEATVPSTDLRRSREFYEGVLGLPPSAGHSPGVEVLYECAGGTRLLVYERGGSILPAHTSAHFVVEDVEATVAELRGRGVRFEDYDLPEFTTRDGVATIGDLKFAWFKDPDLNVIGIHD
jgi:catechol 2,3-dioxygenase-like lactoylglutathione lyase family enzyme